MGVGAVKEERGAYVSTVFLSALQTFLDFGISHESSIEQLAVTFGFDPYAL